MKKWIYLLTLVVLLLIPARGPVEAIDSGEWSYTILDDGSAKITDYSGEEANLVIPSSLDGHPVSVIGEKVFYESSLTSVEIPEGITVIGDEAFAACSNLTRITLPESITYIAEGAFSSTGLTYVSLPSNLKVIDKEAFSLCYSLQNITLPESLRAIGERAFGNTGLLYIDIPEGVTSIGAYAFANCSNLANVSLPNSLTTIDGNPFDNSKAIGSIKISADHPVFEVVDGVLFDKKEHRLIYYPAGSSAVSYTVPEGVKVIGKEAFSGAFNLRSISLPGSLRSIEADAFSVTGLISVDIPEGVTSIGDYAFSGCNGLVSVSLPRSLTSIGENPFKECLLFATVQVAADHPAFEVVDGILFDKKEHRLIVATASFSIASYQIPDGTTSIDEYAFYNRSAPTELYMPDSVTSIGENAFKECVYLSSVTLSNNLRSIPVGAFTRTPLRSVEIPGGVTTIGAYAFSKCNYLESVTLPQSLTSIEGGAFMETGLTRVMLPQNLTYIDELAFVPKNQISFSVLSGSYAETWALQNGVSYIYYVVGREITKEEFYAITNGN